MKLFELIWFLLSTILNMIFYIIISPGLLIRYYINRKARKVVEVGDHGRFKNLMGSYTNYTVENIDGDKLCIKTSNSTQWISRKGHKII